MIYKIVFIALMSGLLLFCVAGIAASLNKIQDQLKAIQDGIEELRNRTPLDVASVSTSVTGAGPGYSKTF